MNERIEKLVTEAFFDESTNGPDEKMYTLGERKMQLFAELIVREVFAKIEDERFEIYQPVKESVMKHFGVKE